MFDQMESSFFNVWQGPGRGGPIGACRSGVGTFPGRARGREIGHPARLTIAVASDPAMGEEIVRRLNKSDWNDQEDQWRSDGAEAAGKGLARPMTRPRWLI